MKRIDPIFWYQGILDKFDSHRTLNNGNSNISQSFLFGSYTFRAKNAGKHWDKSIGLECTTRHLLSCIDSNINHRATHLKQILTTRDIFGQFTGFVKPSITLLEEEANAIERHTWAQEWIRIETIDMIEQTIDAQAEIAIDERFDHSRIFIEDSA